MSILQNVWYNILIISLFLLLTLILNLTIFLTTLLTRNLKTISNEFVCHLSLVCLLGSTLQLVCVVVEVTVEGEQGIGDVLCLLEQIVGILMFSAASGIVFCFGFYRFMAIVRPLTTLVHVRLNTIRVVMFAPWALAAFLAFLCNLESQVCRHRDWSNMEQSAYLTFFIITVVIPVLLMCGFFIGIFLKTRENKRHEGQVQKYHEQNMMSLTNLQRAGSTEDVVIRNPNFELNNEIHQHAVTRWNGIADLAISNQCETTHGKAERSLSLSSISRDSVFERPMAPTYCDTSELVCTTLSALQPKSSVKSKVSTTPSLVRSRNSSENIDFITPEVESENFFQDMMEELHKSFRGSKHSSGLNLYHSNMTLGSGIPDPTISEAPDDETQNLSKALHDKLLLHELSFDNSERTYDVDVTPSHTPCFLPPSPPRVASSKTPSCSSSSKTSDNSGNSDHQKDEASSPPDSPKVSSGKASSKLPKTKFLTEQEFDSSFSEEAEEEVRRKIQPIDKWLLERIMTIERSKLEKLGNGKGEEEKTPKPEIKPEQAESSERTRRDSGYGEGYSITLLLVLYFVLFCLLQVQYTIIVLCHMLTTPNTTVALDNDITFLLHVSYYIFVPIVTLVVCAPLKTVVYANTVRFCVTCRCGW